MLGLRTFGLRAVMSSAKIVDMLMMAMEMFARCLPDVCQMFASLVRNNCSQMEMLHSVMRNKGSHQQDMVLGLITRERQAQIPPVGTEMVIMG